MTALVTGLGLLCAFQIKHMLADFFWQSSWMVSGKGIYGHRGGLAHSGLHVALSALILLVLALPVALFLALLIGEFAIHYHTDWGKEQLVRSRGLEPTDKAFWVMAGLDQFVHQMTYLAMVAFALFPIVTQ